MDISDLCNDLFSVLGPSPGADARAGVSAPSWPVSTKFHRSNVSSSVPTQWSTPVRTWPIVLMGIELALMGAVAMWAWNQDIGAAPSRGEPVVSSQTSGTEAAIASCVAGVTPAGSVLDARLVDEAFVQASLASESTAVPVTHDPVATAAVGSGDAPPAPAGGESPICGESDQLDGGSDLAMVDAFLRGDPAARRWLRAVVETEGRTPLPPHPADLAYFAQAVEVIGEHATGMLLLRALVDRAERGERAERVELHLRRWCAHDDDGPRQLNPAESRSAPEPHPAWRGGKSAAALLGIPARAMCRPLDRDAQQQSGGTVTSCSFFARAHGRSLTSLVAATGAVCSFGR